MAKKNVNLLGRLIWTQIVSVLSFFLGMNYFSLLIIYTAVVLIIADYCREQKSNVWVYTPTNLDLYNKI